MQMRGWHSMAACVIAAGLLAGCASKGPRAPAPVEARSSGARATVPTPPVAIEPAKNIPGAEHANKPGYYTVRPGDTLIRIALDAGQNWRDIARWNNLDNPNLIEVGQVLRVTSPTSAATEVARNPAPNTAAIAAARPGTPIPPGA